MSQAQQNCTNVFNQLDIVMDQINNQVLIGNFYCTSCNLTPLGYQTCQCIQDCEPFRNQEFEDCWYGCEVEPYPQDQYYCELQCEEYFGYTYNTYPYTQCVNTCGEVSLTEVVRVPFEFDYQLRIWYTTNITIPDPPIGPPNVTFWRSGHSTQFPSYFTNTYSPGLPEEPISYCYQAIATITYDDGTCCTFIDFACFSLG